MKKSLLTTIAFLLTAFISTTAQAQILVIIEESPAYRPAAPAPRPCPPPAPVVRRMAPVAAPQQAMYPTVPNEFSYNNFMPMRRWTLGIISQSSAADEAYSGGGMFIQYMFSRKFGIEGSIVGMTADSYETGYYSKESTRAGLSALYFMGNGLKNTGVSWYLKGGLMWNSVYSMDYDSYYGEESSEATHLEGGIGFQWRLFSGWLSFGSEVTLSVPMEEENTDDYYSSAYSPSLNFRLFAAIHF